MQRFITLLADGTKKVVDAINTTAGAADAGKIVATGPNGKLAPELLPDGIGTNNRVVPASEALAAGDLVNLFNDAGALKARKADASTTGKAADGYVAAAFAQGADATVYIEGVNNQLAGLTPGDRLFLSAATPGDVTDAAPSGSGEVVQVVGRALSATEATFEPGEPVALA